MALAIVPCVLLATAPLAGQESVARRNAAPRPATGTVIGRVMDALGQPVPAAQVWISYRHGAGRRLGKTVADGTGMFVLSRLPLSNRRLRVQATAPDRVVAEAEVHLTRAQPRARVRLRLWDAVPLAVRVVEEGGEPIAGAHVSAAFDFARVFGTQPQGQGVTGQDGRCLLPKIPLGEIHVRAWAPGRRMAEDVIYVRDKQEITLKPPKGRGTELSVQVRGLTAKERGQVLVQVLPNYRGYHLVLPAPLVRGRLDDKGRWRVAGLPDLDLQVLVWPMGLDCRFKPATHRLESEQGPHDIKFETLRDKTTLAGLLRDDKGRPMARQVVVGLAAGQRVEAVTDADGRFKSQAPVLPNSYWVLSLVGSAYVLDSGAPKGRRPAQGLNQQRQQRVKIGPNQTLQLRAVRGSRVRGQVVGRQGRPVPLVPVVLEYRRPLRARQWAAVATTNADGAGRFAFDAIPDTTQELRVRVLDHARAGHSEAFQIRPGLDLDGVELLVRPAGVIEGVVRDKKGKPIPGARVFVWGWDLTRKVKTDAGVEVLSDRKGRYRFVGIEPGAYYLGLRIRGTHALAYSGQKDAFEVGFGETVVRNLDG